MTRRLVLVARDDRRSIPLLRSQRGHNVAEGRVARFLLSAAIVRLQAFAILEELYPFSTFLSE
ncbi:MAG: hypothetical protein ACP5M0_11975 [Desulfomonilaceae bacterium]